MIFNCSRPASQTNNFGIFIFDKTLGSFVCTTFISFIFVNNANSRSKKISLTLNNVTRFSKSFSVNKKALEVVDDPAVVPKGETINVGTKDDVSAVKKVGCCSTFSLKFYLMFISL